MRRRGSVSRRAASRAPIESGAGAWRLARARPTRRSRTSRSRSASSRTNSSANSGLPSARSRIGPLELRRHDGPEQVGDEAAVVGVGERRRGRCGSQPPSAPRSPARLEQLRAGRRHDQQRDAVGAAAELLEEGEQGVVGPVHVLEDEDGGRPSAMCSRKRRQAPNSSSRSAAAPESTPSERQQPLAEPVALRRRRAATAPASPSRRPGRRLEDPGVGLDDLAERPERDPVAVRAGSGPGASDEPGVGRRLAASSAEDAALADARARRRRDELGRRRRRRASSNAARSRSSSIARPTYGAGVGHARTSPTRGARRARGRRGPARPCP